MVSSAYVEKKINLLTDYSDVRFNPGVRHTGSVPIEYVTKKIILKFNVFNSAVADTSFVRQMKIVETISAAVHAIPPSMPKLPPVNQAGPRSLP